MTLTIKMDGNMWYCHGEDFENIQISIVGWGETEKEAVLDYIRQIYT